MRLHRGRNREEVARIATTAKSTNCRATVLNAKIPPSCHVCFDGEFARQSGEQMVYFYKFVFGRSVTGWHGL